MRLMIIGLPGIGFVSRNLAMSFLSVVPSTSYPMVISTRLVEIERCTKNSNNIGEPQHHRNP